MEGVGGRENHSVVGRAGKTASARSTSTEPGKLRKPAPDQKPSDARRPAVSEALLEILKIPLFCLRRRFNLVATKREILRYC